METLRASGFTSWILQQGQECRLAARFFPVFIPALEPAAFLGQAALVVLTEFGEGGLLPFPSDELAVLDWAAEFFQSGNCRSAIIGPAQNFLQSLNGRIKRFAKRRSETGRQNLHDIAQALARNTDLVQVFGIGEISTRGFVERAD